MKITRQSVITGVVRTRDIPVNPDDYMAFMHESVSIDESMPYITDEDKQFILSGITPDEWKLAFSEKNQEL